MILIVARNRKGVIGANQGIPWKCSRDMQRFKQLTTGQVVIMGRKTYESIGRPLPNRVNVVVTKSDPNRFPKCVVAKSLDEAIKLVTPLERKIYIIGGGEIYRQAIIDASTIMLTEIKDDSDGDTFFEFNEDEWKEVDYDEYDDCVFRTLVRNYQVTSP